jgi:hypothetical protein
MNIRGAYKNELAQQGEDSQSGSAAPDPAQ